MRTTSDRRRYYSDDLVPPARPPTLAFSIDISALLLSSRIAACITTGGGFLSQPPSVRSDIRPNNTIQALSGVLFNVMRGAQFFQDRVFQMPCVAKSCKVRLMQNHGQRLRPGSVGSPQLLFKRVILRLRKKDDGAAKGRPRQRISDLQPRDLDVGTQLTAAESRRRAALARNGCVAFRW